MDVGKSIIYKNAMCTMLSNKLTNKTLKRHNIGLNAEEAVILDQVCERGRMSQRQIGKVVAKTPSSVSRHIDNLVQKGYVERSVDTSDRRRSWITGTEKAAEFRRIMMKAGLATIDSEITGVSREELKTTARVLDNYIRYLTSALHQGERP